MMLKSEGVLGLQVGREGFGFTKQDLGWVKASG